jgi:methanethiol S-methyltransferase
MNRTLALAYGVASYFVFLVSFLYAIGFVGNQWVPKSIDSRQDGPLSVALPVDIALLSLFAVQHSVMARSSFKRWWTGIIPPPLERSTYVLVSSLLLALLFWQWRPIPGNLWQITNPLGRQLVLAVFWAGWALVLLSTFQISHFDLFGLRQVYLYFSEQEYTSIPFETHGFYGRVRHPIMLGFLIAFWAAPTMTIGHLLFAAATTIYILVAVQFEERDLVRFHGEQYRAYRNQVRMFLPFPKNPKR